MKSLREQLQEIKAMKLGIDYSTPFHLQANEKILPIDPDPITIDFSVIEIKAMLEAEEQK